MFSSTTLDGYSWSIKSMVYGWAQVSFLVVPKVQIRIFAIMAWNSLQIYFKINIYTKFFSIFRFLVNSIMYRTLHQRQIKWRKYGNVEIYDFVDCKSVKVTAVNCKLEVPLFILTEIYIINSIISSEK